METIYELIKSLGIKRTYLGYYYLATAIQLVLDKEERLLFIYKLLYQEIAEIYHTTPFCVERNIRTVKNLYWEKGDHSLLNQIAGCCIYENPCNSDFIDILACHIKKQSTEFNRELEL